VDHRGGKLVGKNLIVGQIFEELVEEEGEICTMDGRRRLKPSGQFRPKLEANMVCYGLQAQQMCSHCQVETIMVIMVWCAR
jgi:hypothetical protein